MPIKGAHKNCMNANTKISQPPYITDVDKLSPDISINKLGKIGNIMPKPMESINDVKKIKARAYLFKNIMLNFA